MNNRLAVFERALAECRRLQSSQPYVHETLKIIEEQVEYLMAVETGKRTDIELLHCIDIGLRTVREIEEGLHDEAAADVFHEVSGIAGRMQFERPLTNGAQQGVPADGSRPAGEPRR